MKKSIVTFVLSLFLSIIVSASPQSDIDKANKAYQEGFFENAVSLYEKVIEQGYSSPILYYNLGNAYFKSGQFPLAILNYERAKRLDPSNEDIIYNLNIANNSIIDKIDLLPELFYEKWWESIKQLFSPDGWSKATIVSFFIFFVVVALFFLSSTYKARKAFLTAALAVFLLTVFTFIISLETYKEANNRKEAIVFAASLPVKGSPEETGVDLFVIHEGLKVTIIDELKGWKEIQIANGSKGWVKEESIVHI